MTRVSLRESYDNKDVVAQIYAIRDTAESAEDSAEQAVTTANTASEHVDALVPQVEGAVQNANSASASAQASAQTVAGYENRLATVETDLNAVTLRVTTAEGDIVTIQGRVTALETADGQNVKINAINNYAVGLTGAQDFNGSKRALQPFNAWERVYRVGGSVGNTTSWFKVCEFTSSTARAFMLKHFTSGNNSEWGEIRFSNGGATFTSHKVANAPSFKITLDVNNVYALWVNPNHTYTYTAVTPIILTAYGDSIANPYDNITFDTTMTAHAEPVVGAEFTQVIDGVLIE